MRLPGVIHVYTVVMVIYCYYGEMLTLVILGYCDDLLFDIACWLSCLNSGIF